MFEQTFKNIDDILWKEAGCQSELDYVEQTSWIIFLKYLDDLESERSTKAELTGKDYNGIIADVYRWEIWAAPKDTDGRIDHNKAPTGHDLKDFVNSELFPYLKKFKAEAESPAVKKQITALIDLLKPLKTRQIDVLATTYASWNNLLILGNDVSLATIIKEALWHARKFEFTDEDFKEAIDFLKVNHLVPEGKGRLVQEKDV